MALYHKDIGFPAELKRPNGAFLVNYSDHALRAAADDRFGSIKLPAAIDFRPGRGAELIECETDAAGLIVKAVWRIPHDEDNDIVMVILMQRKLVKTVWLNRHDDLHATLDAAKYDRP